MGDIRRFRASGAALVLAAAVAAAGAGPASAAAPPRPSGDVVERFAADPLADGRWFASGSWSWEPRATTFSSTGPGTGSLLWVPASHFTGTLSLRFRLGRAGSRARLLFAHDPSTGAYRWVEVAAGDPGRITLGQSGTIRGSAAGVIQAWRAPVAAGAWLDLGVRIAANKGVTVSLGGAPLFTAAASPLAQGQVGFGSLGGPVGFDAFSFAAEPDGEPCRECHAGQADQPLAPNVYTYWDGKWWDRTYGGLPTVQQGGHGDPGGKAALDCTGANGCHEMRQPSPEGHRNGVREGRAHQSVNSYHLRPGFIVENPQHPWDAQLVFDNYCNTACHTAPTVAVASHEHEKADHLPVAGAVQLGTLNDFGYPTTVPDGETLPLPVDSDITRRATPTEPDYAPCISCHDPHGSDSALLSSARVSNLMLREIFIVQGKLDLSLCRICHY